MAETEAPPDATVFRSGGKSYFLFMGALEMRALQREWGLVRSGADTPEAWKKKQEEFQDRLDGGAMEDKLSVIRHALTRWANAATHLLGPVKVDDAMIGAITDGIEQPNGQPRKAPFVLVSELHRRFYFECFGFPSFEKQDEGAGPKEPGRKAAARTPKRS